MKRPARTYMRHAQPVRAEKKVSKGKRANEGLLGLLWRRRCVVRTFEAATAEDMRMC